MPLLDESVFLPNQTYIGYLPHNEGGNLLQAPTVEQIAEFDPVTPDALFTELGMKHLGHTDLDEDIEGDEEGGDSEVRGTRQNPNLRERVEPVVDYFTVHAVQNTPDVLDLYYGPGGQRSNGTYKLPASGIGRATLCAVLVIDCDAVTGNLGEFIPRCNIRRGGPVGREGENFRRYPLRFTPLVSSSGDGTTFIHETLFAEEALLAPTGLAAPTSTATTVQLTWNAVAGAASYQVQRSSNGTSGWTDVTSGAGGAPATPGTTVTGLTAATTYYWRVAAVSATPLTGTYTAALLKATTA